MSKRAATAEPIFGTDSFLDVTANLVGVLIVFIVLVGMRVRAIPTDADVHDDEINRRLAVLQAGIDELIRSRQGFESELEGVQRGLAAKQESLTQIQSTRIGSEHAAQSIIADSEAERLDLANLESERSNVELQLVSLTGELASAKAAPSVVRQLVHRSPISRAINSDEIHFELLGSRVAFVDLESLLEKVKLKCRLMESEIRARGRISAEAGPAGPFRIRFTIARDDMPFSQSMFYTSNSFHAKLLDWQINPVDGERGESVEEAMQPGSQLDLVLRRFSPNKHALTLWTYADSFSAFRQLRDYLSDRGYVVAARPLPMGIPIRGSATGTRSVAQ